LAGDRARAGLSSPGTKIDMKPELTIVLVNFNDKAHLEDCLSSLEEGTSKLAAEVILVDNHSQDGSPELVRTSFPWVKLIQNMENLGYARANNIGIKASSGEFILFLNTDTVVPPEALPALVAELRARTRVGAVGPALVHESGRYQVSFGGRRNFFSEIGQKYFLNPYYKSVLGRSSKPRDVWWVSGACLLARRTAVEEVGFFDENYFLYFEDIDLCLRMRAKGWKVIFYPGIRITHAGAATTSTLKLQTRLEYRRSQVYFYSKHNSRMSAILLKIFLKLNFGLAALLKARTPEEKELVRSQKARIFGNGDNL